MEDEIENENSYLKNWRTSFRGVNNINTLTFNWGKKFSVSEEDQNTYFVSLYQKYF